MKDFRVECDKCPVAFYCQEAIKEVSSEIDKDDCLLVEAIQLVLREYVGARRTYDTQVVIFNKIEEEREAKKGG